MQSSSPERGNLPHGHQTPRRPTLSTTTPVKQTSPRVDLSLDTSAIPNDVEWPVRPPISPITPTLTPAELQVEHHQQNQLNATSHISQSSVPPDPVSLEDNPDAIALRSAISILQIQRQQSIKDMQSLERLKQAAIHDPQGFLAELKDNKLAQPSPSGVDIDVQMDVDGQESNLNNQSRFGAIPKAQNVVRCPPVNWDKYHVVGESLDRLHEQQKKYPGITEEQIQRSGHPPKHEIAAPYRLGIDYLEGKTTMAQPRT